MKTIATVTLYDILIQDDEHVGQDDQWKYKAVVNGSRIKLGQCIGVGVDDDKLKFELEVLEDDKITDKGSVTHEWLYTECRGKKYALDVDVTENRGRYTGNTAKVYFYIEVL